MISFVIPARNESASLPVLVDEIKAVSGWYEWEYEIILIDDGSTDGTWRAIREIASANVSVKGIKLRRNFGKGPALMAGLEEIKGDIVFMMDADLQDNPEDAPKFIDELNNGADAVIGWRVLRQDRLAKRILSKFFNAVVGSTGLRIHDHNCGFKCFRTEVLSDLRLYGDMHRYIPLLAHMNGFKVSEVPVNHRERKFGASNYGFGRTYRGFFDLLTVLFLKGFKFRPMHFLGSVGLISLLLGLGGLAYLAVVWLAGHGIGGRPLIVYSAAFALLGCQILTTGILAELMTAHFAKNERLFSVSDKTSREVKQSTVLLHKTKKVEQSVSVNL